MERPVPAPPVREPLYNDLGDLNSNWEKWLALISNNSVNMRIENVSVPSSTVPANNTVRISVDVDEIRDGDIVLAMEKPSHTAGVAVAGYYVRGDGEVGLILSNVTDSDIITPKQTYRIAFIRA